MLLSGFTVNCMLYPKYLRQCWGGMFTNWDAVMRTSQRELITLGLFYGFAQRNLITICGDMIKFYDAWRVKWLTSNLLPPSLYRFVRVTINYSLPPPRHVYAKAVTGPTPPPMYWDAWLAPSVIIPTPFLLNGGMVNNADKIAQNLALLVQIDYNTIALAAKKASLLVIPIISVIL